jgi:segregation and condensation protein A
VSRETLTLRERMTEVLEKLSRGEFMPFVSLFKIEEGRLGVVVTFMSILELVKEGLIDLVQTESFGPIHLRARVQESGGHGYDLEFAEETGSGEDAFEHEPEPEPPVNADLWDESAETGPADKAVEQE